jgi:DNA-binding NarL/FixJ family response regulator
LVEGTWSLVDQEDAGGRRHVVAYRNPLPCSSDLSLSPREREVVQLIALGSTTKHAAYTLGVSPSAIAHRTRSALRKLRLPSALELVKAYNHLRSGAGHGNDLRLSGDLVARERAHSTDHFSLTPKERTIRDLLAQGLSNREIAERSHCAERTVANHVASIMRKTGASSRRDVVSKTE